MTKLVAHWKAMALVGCAVWLFWPLLRFLATSEHGLFVFIGMAIGPFAYRAHIRKREEALADAARRRAIRESYREIGL